MAEDPSLPLLVHGQGRDLTSHARASREQILRDVRRHGAVLFRGWRIDGAEGVADTVRALDVLRCDISCSAGPRVEVAPGIFTSNEAPPWEAIPVHHEMAQCEDPPRYVCFFCDTPALVGGATPLVRSRDVARYLRRRHPEVAARLAEHGVRYVREYPARTDMTSPLGKSWRDTFGVQTRAQAEDAMRRNDLDWTWTADGEASNLRTTSCRSMNVLRLLQTMGEEEEETHEEVFFIAAESVFASPATGRPEKSFVYGDGTPLDPSSLAALRDVGREAFTTSSRFAWHTGDLLVIDNAAVMHARDSFTPPRRLLVSLAGSL